MKKFPIIFISKLLDFFIFLWYNIIVKVDIAKAKMKKFFISKLLDFSNLMWYNIIVKVKGHG